MITAGNTKLGKLISCWSIPAFMSCPGATLTCLRSCYALTNRFKNGPVFQAHLRNLEFSHTPEFVPYMQGQLSRHRYPVLRIHVAGDFYSSTYTDNWIKIATASPRTRFFFYTRSWRIEGILPSLLALGSLENVSPWWSVDLATGDPPLIPGFRSAYMAVDDRDARRAPAYCDLVFRDSPDTVLKKANGIQVCPPETGVKKIHDRVSCTVCGICWRDSKFSFADAVYQAVDVEEILAPSSLKQLAL